MQSGKKFRQLLPILNSDVLCQLYGWWGVDYSNTGNFQCAHVITQAFDSFFTIAIRTYKLSFFKMEDTNTLLAYIIRFLSFLQIFL